MDSIREKEQRLKEYSGLSLAYLGDAVWELTVREFFIQKGYKVGKLNLMVKKYVNAKSQSKLYNLLKEQLTEKKLDLGKQEKLCLDQGRKGKNSNIRSFPKNCTVEEYRNATGFEAVVGALYLLEEHLVIKKIFMTYHKELYNEKEINEGN